MTVPPSQTVTPLEAARDLAQVVASTGEYGDRTREDAHALLRAFECWVPLVKLLETELALRPSLDAYMEIIRTYSLYIDDIDPTIHYCIQLIEQLKVPFEVFSKSVLSVVLGPDEFLRRATILRAMVPHFKERERVQCLEELGTLYDKKLFDDQALHNIHSEIINIDPKNLKTLKYFKVFHTYNEKWNDVEAILRRMLRVVHEKERHRIIHELASLLLYRRGQAQNAIDLLNQASDPGYLDTFSLLFDAYQTLGDWAQCLVQLRGLLKRQQNSNLYGVIHFRIGEYQRRLGDQASAIKSFESALDSGLTVLEVYEQLIEIYLERKDNPAVRLWLNRCEERLKSSENRERLQALQTYLSA